MTTSARDPLRLALIRASMVMGELLFGGVIYFQHHQGGWRAEPVPEALRYLPLGALVGAIIGMLVLRPIWARATEVQRRTTLAMVGWAIGQVAALTGAIYYWFTDDPQWLITGIIVLLLSFLLFPIRTES